jgi:hypothetical protein
MYRIVAEREMQVNRFHDCSDMDTLVSEHA